MDSKDLFIAIFALCALGGTVSVFRPLVHAIAKRIAEGPRRQPSADQLAQWRAELLDALQQLRQQVSEVAERVDFAERLLARQHEAERLAPPPS